MACSGADLDVGDSEEMEPDVGESADGIIRATDDGGHDQTVMLYQKFVATNGGIGTRTCSGTYIADRVVLTAAHCLADTFGDQVYVYFGDNFAADFASEVTDFGSSIHVPAPGQPSHFSKADSFEQHPDYDAELHYPDLALVFLDRALPFKPISPAYGRLGNAWNGRKATIEGWGADAAPTPTTGSGTRVQRTGRATLLGSPTAADYHPEDPNAGMLDPHIRRNILKVDGDAPNSNACFGDSGGPLYVKWFGKNYLVGTGYFVGLSCEDYSLFTRMDPFRRYLENGQDRGGRESIDPDLDCVVANDDGTYTAFFGYDNDNGVSIEIPYGSKNKLALDTDGFRPTKFLPGEHTFQFAVDFTRNQTVTYRIDPPHGHANEIRVTKRSHACGAEDADNVAYGKYCENVLRSGCDDMPDFPGCMSLTRDNAQFIVDAFPDCVDEDQALRACEAKTESGADHWTCNPGSVPFSNDCNPEVDALFSCFYGF